MARGETGLVIITGPEFRAVANRLREIDSTFPTRLRQAMRRSATPILQDLRQAALALPARKAKHTGLRARLAKSVGVQVGVGRNARMRFITKMDDPQEAELPRGEDSGERGWRHPVFGHDVWVHQRGGSWFRETIADQRPDIERRLQDVLDQAAQQIQDAGRV